MNNRSFRARMASVTIGMVMCVLPQFICAQAGMPGAGSSAPPQPYTAEFKIIRVQTLANGTTITHESKEAFAHDSQGRTMRANTPEIAAASGRPSSTFVFVRDPVADTQINWNSLDKKARVIKMPPPDQRQGCWSTATQGMTIGYGGVPRIAAPGGNGSGAPAAASSSTIFAVSGASATGPVLPHPSPVKPVREDLGTDTIMGIEVHGHRTTMTTPAGQVGNSEPLVRTTETWTAPSLGIVLRESSDDPQSGKMTRELVSLDLSEPNPSTFQPPEGYEVLTEEMQPIACQQRP